MFSPWFEIYRKILFFLLLAIMIIGIVGNVIVITYFICKVYKYRVKKISSYHFATMHLAMVDLLTCVYVLISLFLPKNAVEPGPLSATPSHIRMSLSSTSCWALTMLSYERFRAITNPFKRTSRKRYIFMACIFTWVISAVLYFPLHIPKISKAMFDFKKKMIIQFAYFRW